MITGVMVYNIIMIKRKVMLWGGINSIYTWQYSAWSASMQSALLYPNRDTLSFFSTLNFLYIS